MATDLFTRAKAYRKNHPNTAWTKCVQAVAAGDRATAKKKAAAPKKKAAVGKAHHKKAAAPKKAPRKIKIKIKPGKKGGGTFSISGLHLTKTRQELEHQHALQKMLERHKGLLKEKGLTAGQKQSIRREIEQYKKAIQTSKQHVTALKRSI